jgi:hypothetical protein
MKDSIKYKDVTAMKGSDLHRLLSESRSAKDQKEAQELRKKADRCYTDCIARYNTLMEGTK